MIHIPGELGGLEAKSSGGGGGGFEKLLQGGGWVNNNEDNCEGHSFHPPYSSSYYSLFESNAKSVEDINSSNARLGGG